ncbi:MAG: hypothetical protein Q8P89_02105, partial [bacterium]|nr:hypothetical protein [bacterium]
MKNWKILGKTEELKNLSAGRQGKRIEERQKELIKILLKNRGLTAKKEIEEFFNPPNPSTLSPKPLDIDPKELTKAVKRIKKALDSKEKIIVYGDYDADGICGTA